MFKKLKKFMNLMNKMTEMESKLDLLQKERERRDTEERAEIKRKANLLYEREQVNQIENPTEKELEGFDSVIDFKSEKLLERQILSEDGVTEDEIKKAGLTKKEYVKQASGRIRTKFVDGEEVLY